MPKEPVYGPEYEYHSKLKKESTEEKVDRMLERKETPTPRQEPHILYVQLNPDEGYTNVGQFPSKQSALQAMYDNYSGYPYKILSIADAIREGEKQEIRRRRLEMLRQAKEAAIASGKAVSKGVKAVGAGISKAEQKLSEFEEKRERYLDEQSKKQMEREQREYRRMQLAEQRELLRAKKELIQEELRQQAHEREELRSLKEERPSYGGQFYAPTKSRLNINQPPSPKFTIQSPSPLMKQPWTVSGKAQQRYPLHTPPKAPLSLWGGPLVQRPYVQKRPIKKKKPTKKHKKKKQKR